MSKYLFVKYGPPASGKSAIDKLIQEEYNISADNLYINDIDAIVESSDLYKENISKAGCIDFYNSHDYTSARGQTDKIKKCTDIYFETRAALNAAKIADEYSANAVAQGKNIVYETTGCGDISWLLNEINTIYKPNGYKVIVYYPVALPDELVNRSYNRAKSSGRFADEEYINKCVPSALDNILRFKGHADKIIMFGSGNITNDGANSMKSPSCTTLEINNINNLTSGFIREKINNIVDNYCGIKTGGNTGPLYSLLNLSYTTYLYISIVIILLFVILYFSIKYISGNAFILFDNCDNSDITHCARLCVCR